MTEYRKELIQNTIDTWSPNYGYKISEHEAVEIIENMTRFVEVLDEFARDTAAELTEKLITNGSFTKVSDIDNLVPDEKGLYCIRLIEGERLPSKYQEELEERKSRLLYIGKAENKSLEKRFLRQELRAKGHGTFFRSVGAMLGYAPPRGSLSNRKNQNNYKFSRADEAAIISWMNQHLEASWTAFDGPFVIEQYLIARHAPLLNIDSNPQALAVLKAARRKCRKIARGEICV